jgi:glycosyltransferase involved in cell wall biosynthesis
MERRFPTASFITITNGFSTGSMPPPLRNFPADKCLFRYVGLLNERRTPNSLLKGLAIACQNPALKARVGLEFVGPMAGHEHLIEQLGLQEVVTSRGLVSQQDSLRLMRGSDVNVVLQTIREGQDVIAGKTFEYLAAGKPILAAVAEQGGDAWLLRQVGGAEIVPYDEPEKIARAIERCFERFLHTPVPAPASKLAAFERKELARQLARLFDEVLAEPR